MTGKSIPLERLHDELCAALKDAGGLGLEDILEREENVPIADSYFQEEAVIVEVKSLTTDRNKTPSVKAKAGAILSRHAAAGRIAVPFGEVRVSLPDVHPAVAEDLLRNLGKRVAKELTKANAQIRASKERLRRDDATGLCIFITSAGFDVHSGVIVTAAERQLRGGKCSSIDELMIIAVPDVHESSDEASGFISFHPRGEGRSTPASLKRRIADAWVARAARLTGTNARIEFAEPSEFEDRFVVPVSGMRDG